MSKVVCFAYQEDGLIGWNICSAFLGSISQNNIGATNQLWPNKQIKIPQTPTLQENRKSGSLES